MPTAQQLEAVLLRNTVKIVLGTPLILGAYFREWLVSFLANTTLLSLPELSSWLVVSILGLLPLFLYFLARYLITKKALLTVKPNYFVEQRNDRLWEQVTNDRAREKKT